MKTKQTSAVVKSTTKLHKAIDFSNKVLYVGMDVHKNSWNLGIHLNDMFVKNIHQKPNPHLMAAYLKQHFPNARYRTAYEAGKFGFWIQRQLTGLGIECLVVNPAHIPKFQKNSLQKTDSRVSRNIGHRLQNGDLKGIHIPDEQWSRKWYCSFIAKGSGKILQRGGRILLWYCISRNK